MTRDTPSLAGKRTVLVAVAVLIVVMLGGLLIAFLLKLSDSARAQDINIQCLSLKGVMRFYEQRYDETSVALAVSEDGKAAFTLMLAPTGTFSLLVTTPEGCTSRIAAGRDWRFDKPQPPGQDS